MGCRGLCDRIKGNKYCFKYNGAYCSVCMKWLHFDSYGFKCRCCNQRLRLRNKGTKIKLIEHEEENCKYDNALKILLNKIMIYEPVQWVPVAAS
jgi:hypothetical protein